MAIHLLPRSDGDTYLERDGADTEALVLKDVYRISTESRNGSAVSIPAAHGFGEAIELRYTSARSNSQFQGLFMEVRTSVANSSTIRGAEIKAAQEGAVAVGTIEGLSARADARSATTGNITNLYGVTAEIGSNSDAYTGTVTSAAAFRGKLQLEDGATYTTAYVFRAEAEAISGADTITAIVGSGTFTSVTPDSLIDFSSVESANYDSNTKVVLMKFKGANGTTYYLVHDTDSATAVEVVTSVS